jgi:hypothetical protein
VSVLLRSIQAAAEGAADDLHKNVEKLGPEGSGPLDQARAASQQDLATALGAVISRLGVVARMGNEIAQVRRLRWRGIIKLIVATGSPVCECGLENINLRAPGTSFS